MKAITLDEAKKHLNIDSTFTEDDNYIQQLISVATEAVLINADIASGSLGDGEYSSLRHAILLLIGNLYANRESTTYSTISEVPMAFKYLVNLNRNFSVG